MAFVRQGQQIGLVDANGVLLTMPAAMMAQHHYSFPVVTGIDPQRPARARKGRMAVYERLLAELDANGQHLSEQISEIDLTDPEDARVLMPEQGTTSWPILAKTIFWSAISGTRRTSANGGNSIPSWRLWICATTSRWCLK